MPENFETRKQQYELLPQNLKGLDQYSGIFEKDKKFLAGLKKEGIIWPVEMQGNSFTLADKKEFKISYPLGDIFASFVVAIHELGHLRQFEVDNKFEQESETTPEGTKYKLKNIDDSPALEKSAWERGWKRAKTYAPEYITMLEERFLKSRKQGYCKKFNNFEDFIAYIEKVTSKIVLFQTRPEIRDLKDEQLGQAIGHEIKKDPLTKEFFSRPEVWKTGEKVNQQEIESFIKKVAGGTAREKYEIE